MDKTVNVSEEILAILGHGDFDHRNMLFEASKALNYGAHQLTIPVKNSPNRIESVTITLNHSAGIEPEQTSFI